MRRAPALYHPAHSEEPMLTGGCFCGRVRYEARGPAFNRTYCHCSICRRTSGAPFVAWFSVARSQLRFAGEPARFRSSEKATRSFCPECGTQLAFELDGARDEIDLTTCSLDDPNRMAPTDHTRVSSKLEWVKLGDGLPQFRESREEG
jgi:hypothetical protein